MRVTHLPVKAVCMALFEVDQKEHLNFASHYSGIQCYGNKYEPFSFHLQVNKRAFLQQFHRILEAI